VTIYTPLQQDYEIIDISIRTGMTVLLLTRGKSNKWCHIWWLSCGYFHIIFSSQVPLLRHKLYCTLLSSLVRRCRHFYTTTGLLWTSWTW